MHSVELTSEEQKFLLAALKAHACNQLVVSVSNWFGVGCNSEADVSMIEEELINSLRWKLSEKISSEARQWSEILPDFHEVAGHVAA